MSQKRRIGNIIEARMSSSRLPGKVLKECLGKPMLQHQIERARRSKLLDDVIIATTINPADDAIEQLGQSIGAPVFRGSEEDVLDRVLQAARTHDVDVIVETPGDCPLLDWRIMDEVISRHESGDWDYVSNNLELTYPGGMDVQVFSTNILADVDRRTDDPVDHEHVSLFIYRNQDIYRCDNVVAPKELNVPDIKFLLDTPKDFALISAVIDALYPENPDFSCADIIQLMQDSPELKALNADVQRTVV